MRLDREKTERAGNRSGFERLLLLLGADRNEAGRRYEKLRRKLITFFQCHGSIHAEDAADEALNRVAEQIEGGQEIQNLSAYTLGVARLLLKESARRQIREAAILSLRPGLMLAEPAEDPELRAHCLEKCLAMLPLETRQLMFQYCQGEWAERSARRKQLAIELGISPTALRIRVHRIRAELERNLRRCLAQSANRPR